jgi:hypothetical protein
MPPGPQYANAQQPQQYGIQPAILNSDNHFETTSVIMPT